MDLRERAIQAAKERQEWMKRNEQLAAEKFAEKAKKKFQECFGETEFDIKPISENTAEIVADGLKFTAKKIRAEYAEYVHFYLWVQCANCGKWIREYCENLADVGDILQKGQLCEECEYGNISPAEESDEKKVIRMLREIIEIVGK